MTIIRIFFCLLFLLIPALAHGGGLDGYGCHHNRAKQATSEPCSERM